VIVGLSLVLIPQLNNNNLINNLKKYIEINKEINKKYQETLQQSKLAEDLYNEVIANEKSLYENIETHIYSMNIYFPDGTQVKTLDELEEFIAYLDQLYGKHSNFV
jgi:predicted PurR-regulated permease PerM